MGLATGSGLGDASRSTIPYSGVTVKNWGSSGFGSSSVIDSMISLKVCPIGSYAGSGYALTRSSSQRSQRPFSFGSQGSVHSLQSGPSSSSSGVPAISLMVQVSQISARICFSSQRALHWVQFLVNRRALSRNMPASGSLMRV